MRYESLRNSDAEWGSVLDRVRFDWGKWDLQVAGRPTLARGALVLDRAEHEQVVHAAEALADLASRSRESLRKDPQSLQRLGVQPDLGAVLTHEAPAPLVTRIDFFRTASGWQVSEFNDDCPGGYNEALALPVELGPWLRDDWSVPGDLPEALVRLFGGEGQTSGLLYATAYAEDLQVVELLARLLRAHGCEAVLGSPAHVGLTGDRATLLGRPVDRLVRFFPTEWLPALPNWATWSRLGRQGIDVRNPLAAVATQSKAIHAWLWQEATGGDRALVQRHLPHTTLLEAATAQQALDAPDGVVLKPAFGRMGEGVVLGRECPPDTWRKRVVSALRSSRARPYVMQDRFDAVPVETEPGRTATACVGAYVVGGRFAGYYSRLSTTPVVAYDATNVLTVVEGL